MPIVHGIKVNEPVTGARPIRGISTAVIGLIATATDADATVFPLNKPVLITDVRSALGKAGETGTLSGALQDIANQCSPIIVVVRVAPGVAAGGVTADEATTTNVIGSTANGFYTGMQALLAAEAELGVRPRILGAPGLDRQDVLNALIVVAQRLRGFVYGAGPTSSLSTALDYRQDFSARELMLIYPNWSHRAGSGVACALGLRARIDEEIGWHKTLSNVGVNGVTGMSRNVGFDLMDSANDAGLLNAASITTMVRLNGFRYWGNRTCSDEPLFQFESAVRTAQVLQDEIAHGLTWAIDKPMTVGLIKDILGTINARFRTLKGQDRLIGASAWYDPALNSAVDLASGKLVIDYDYTPSAPAEAITLNQRITDRFYASFGDQLG